MLGWFDVPDPWCYENCMSDYGLYGYSECAGQTQGCAPCVGCCLSQAWCLASCDYPGWFAQWMFQLCFMTCETENGNCGEPTAPPNHS
jgi:hypothetical protein